MSDAFIPRAALRLALSNDAAIESLLSDIPLLCVGLLALGISTFSLVMRRTNLLAIYLYTSALLAFGAAILDLSQILARGPNNVDSGIADAAVTGLINTREVGFALSVGFRFLFFWTFVAERPRGEPPPPPVQDSKGQSYPSGHSADWGKWGFLGFALKWSLLALTISIPIIQIIWRIAQRRFDVIYMVESTIEIVVSALFILKIMLNLFLTWWRPLRFYLAPLVALLINLGVAVGNLILFAFSETTLGRFIQAVELYILILFVLIAAFYKRDNFSRTSRSRRSRGTSSFAILGEKPREPPLLQPGSNPDVVIGQAFSSEDEVQRPVSTVSRIGSWILSRNPLQRPNDVQQRQMGDLEQGTASGVQQTKDVMTEDRAGELKEKESSPEIRVSERSPSPSVPDPEMDNNPLQRPTKGVSFSSYYNMEPPSFLQLTPREGSDSPVYGLDGIINRKPESYSRDSLVAQRETNSLSSFDELLRQQTELDRSIAALRLFSPETSTGLLEPPKPASPSRTKPPLLNRTQSTSTNSYSGQRLDSASGRSEFSLSIFPEPPGTAEANPTTVRMAKSSRAAIWAPTQDLPSIPSSPNQLGTAPRYDSATTQYEITSFIDDLTVPITMQPQNNPSSLGDEDETNLIVAPANTAQPLRPILLVSSAISSVPPTAPTSSSSALSPVAENVDYISTQPTIRPFILGSAAPTVPSRTPGIVPIGPRVRGRSAPASPARRLNISVPRPQLPDNSQTPGAFERPRPPPLILSPEKDDK